MNIVSISDPRLNLQVKQLHGIIFLVLNAADIFES